MPHKKGAGLSERRGTWNRRLKYAYFPKMCFFLDTADIEIRLRNGRKWGTHRGAKEIGDFKSF